MKTCSRCLSFENPFPSKGLVCKVCVKAYKRQNYLANKDRILEQTLAYYYANKDEISDRRKLKYQENPEPVKARVRKYAQANAEKISLYHQKMYEANPEPAKERSRKRRREKPREVKSAELEKRYGISLDDYVTMLGVQRGGCAICGATDSQNKRHKYFHVDHDHLTGRVRGLLCGLCNAGLGHFRDNPAILELAAAYLRR